MLQHSVDCVQQFPHHGDIGLHLRLSSPEEFLVESLHVWFMLSRHDGWQEERSADVGVSLAADAGWLVDRCSGLEDARVETRMGNSLPNVHVLGKNGELGQDLDPRGSGGPLHRGDVKRGSL